MKKLSEINETYIQEEPTKNTPPKSERLLQIESFAHNKSKRADIIKAWTEEVKDHPEAEDMNSEVGSAFDESDLDEDLKAAFDAVGPGGIIFASYENTFWIHYKKQLIRIM